MFAILATLFWSCSTAYGALVVGGLSYKAGVVGAAILAWKLNKIVELGIDIEAIKNSTKDVELHTFELGPDDVPGHPELVHMYSLVDTEYKNLMDCIRHLEIEDGCGRWSEHLHNVCEKNKISYEEMAALFEKHGCDFERLKVLSDKRLKDRDWRKLAGLPVIG